MASPEEQSYLVIPDAHGEYEKIAKMVDLYEPEVGKFLFLGDVINGPNTAGLIKLIRDLGERAITIAGNHEWTCRNALVPGDYSMADIWRDGIWPGYENNMLESYGLKRSQNWKTNASHLREAMAEYGDLDWLNNLPAYFETDDFVAVHAGPELHKPWAEQAKYLSLASSPAARLTEDPDQIFSSKLARASKVPPEVDSRVFVTGHAHVSLTPEERIGPQRVRLASNLKGGHPLFVWNSEHQTVASFQPLAFKL